MHAQKMFVGNMKGPVVLVMLSRAGARKVFFGEARGTVQ